MDTPTTTLAHQRIFDFILSEHPAAAGPEDAEVTMSTEEIFLKLSSFFIVENFTLQILFEWLIANGYIYRNSGTMQPEWLFKNKQIHA